jgi:hypothetical protein
MGQFIGSRPLGWITPLEGILTLAFMAPFGMIAYFGIKGDFRRLFTTVIFVFCFFIPFGSDTPKLASALSRMVNSYS